MSARTSVGRSRLETRDHLRRMCAGYDAALPRVTRLFPTIDIETLILWADDDPHFPLEQAHAVADHLPDASLHVFEDLSHWFMWQDPDQVAHQIRQFVGN